MSSAVADAYGATAAAWERGPARLYERMADRLVAFAEPLAGARALDVGTGSGAAARALLARGAHVVGTDLAPGMLADNRAHRPPAAAGDITRLPFRSAVFDAAVAAFVVNHLPDPADALREMGRVCRPSGVVLVSSFAAGPDPELKAAIEAIAREYGWQRPAWYAELKSSHATAVETTEQMRSGLDRAGLLDSRSWIEEISFADFAPPELAAWRLWSPALAPFVGQLSTDRRRQLFAEATEAANACSAVTLRMLIGRAVAA